MNEIKTKQSKAENQNQKQKQKLSQVRIVFYDPETLIQKNTNKKI